MTRFRVIWLVEGVSWWPPLLPPKLKRDSRQPQPLSARHANWDTRSCFPLPDSDSDLNLSSTAPRRYIGPIWLSGERVFPSAAGDRSCLLYFPMFHLARSLLGFFFFFLNLACRAKMAAARFESSAAKCYIPLWDFREGGVIRSRAWCMFSGGVENVKCNTRGAVAPMWIMCTAWKK